MNAAEVKEAIEGWAKEIDERRAELNDYEEGQLSACKVILKWLKKK